jgi:hypothetical protein
LSGAIPTSAELAPGVSREYNPKPK